jgi:hypothetical protein
MVYSVPNLPYDAGFKDLRSMENLTCVLCKEVFTFRGQSFVICPVCFLAGIEYAARQSHAERQAKSSGPVIFGLQRPDAETLVVGNW